MCKFGKLCDRLRPAPIEIPISTFSSLSLARSLLPLLVLSKCRAEIETYQHSLTQQSCNAIFVLPTEIRLDDEIESNTCVGVCVRFAFDSIHAWISSHPWRRPIQCALLIHWGRGNNLHDNHLSVCEHSSRIGIVAQCDILLHVEGFH